MISELARRVVVRMSMAALAMSCAGYAKCSASYGGGDVLHASSVVVFQFTMRGDVTGDMNFRAMTEDPQMIATARAQLAKPVAERRLFISGPIERGNGGHNLGWHWHFVPDAWRLTEVATEVCDGNAVTVDQAVDYWVDTVGSFCPLGSYVAEERPQ